MSLPSSLEDKKRDRFDHLSTDGETVELPTQGQSHAILISLSTPHLSSSTPHQQYFPEVREPWLPLQPSKHDADDGLSAPADRLLAHARHYRYCRNYSQVSDGSRFSSDEGYYSHTSTSERWCPQVDDLEDAELTTPDSLFISSLASPMRVVTEIYEKDEVQLSHSEATASNHSFSALAHSEHEGVEASPLPVPESHIQANRATGALLAELKQLAISLPNHDGAGGQTSAAESPTPLKLRAFAMHSESELSFMGACTPPYPAGLPSDNLGVDASQLVHMLAANIVQRCLDISLDSSSRTHAPSGYESSSIDSRRTSRDTPATSNYAPSKRSRNEDEDEDDMTGSRRNGRETDHKRKRAGPGQSTKLFACPYAKFDPERYSERNQIERNYRACNSKYLVSIARVKQHLYRTHARPAWYCGNCYAVFKAREQLNEHTRHRPPCEERPACFEEMMTDQQFQDVKRRVLGSSEYESWYKIFNILFPGAPQPLSPYVSTCDPLVVQHFVSFFQWYGPEEFYNVMRDRRDHARGNVDLQASTQAVVDEAFEIALPNYLQLLAQAPQQGFDLDGSRSVAMVEGNLLGGEGAIAHGQSTAGPGAAHSTLDQPIAPFSNEPSTVSSYDPEEDPARNAPGQSFVLGYQPDSFSRPDMPTWYLDPTEIDRAFDAYNGSAAYCQ